jgi:hypothetical protein
MQDLFLKNSDIEGLGLFSNKYLSEYEVIIKRCINASTHEISYFGKYVNHSYNCNAILLYNNGFYDLIALKQISPFEEITADYRYNPTFLKGVEAHFK